MRFLAAYVVKGQWQAIGVAAVTALLSVLLLPIGYLSGATVALVTLRMGPQQGLRIVFGATLLLSLLTLLLLRNPLAGAVYGVALWLPVWTLAISLRRTASPARSTLLASLLGAAFVVAFHLGLDDPAQWWFDFLREALQAALTELPEAEQTQFLASLDYMSGVMTGVMAALLTASLLGCLFLGRWWQAQLYNPGGFGEEFRQLRLGRSVGIVALLLAALLMLPQVPVLVQDLFIVTLVPMALQGLAVAHALIRQGGGHRRLLIVLYVLLLLMTGHAVVVLAFVGVIDNWFDFRRLFGPKGGAE
jgi:hypothetical protein